MKIKEGYYIVRTLKNPILFLDLLDDGIYRFVESMHDATKFNREIDAEVIIKEFIDKNNTDRVLCATRVEVEYRLF